MDCCLYLLGFRRLCHQWRIGQGELDAPAPIFARGTWFKQRVSCTACLIVLDVLEEHGVKVQKSWAHVVEDRLLSNDEVKLPGMDMPSLFLLHSSENYRQVDVIDLVSLKGLAERLARERGDF